MSMSHAKLNSQSIVLGIRTGMYVCMYVCECIYIYIYIYIYVCVCVCVCVCVPYHPIDHYSCCKLVKK